MNDVAEKLLELVERRRTLLEEVARIEAAFALALANVEKPKLLQAVPRATKARKSADGGAKKPAELQELAPHFGILAPAERTVIEARMNGKLPEQIARDLGRTAQSVSTTIYLAKKKLLAARESRPSGEKPATPPASDEEEPPRAPVLTTISTPRAPRERRKRQERQEPRDSEPAVARPKDANFAVFTQEVRQHAVLDREAELELFRRWQQTGDRRLADQLVSANLRLVLSIAKQYDRKRHDLLDLVQEGSIGLFHALSKYDPDRGIRFISYASHWIRAYILKFMITNHHLVKLGTTQEQRKLFFNLYKTRALLEKNGETATAEQIAEALEVDTADVVEMEMRMGSAATSIDAPARDSVGEEAPLFQQLTASDDWRPDVRVERSEFRSAASGWIHTFGALLEGRDRVIFEKRLIAEDPMTLLEIAEEWGVTRERVRQIEEKLKDRLRKFLERASG